jgi:hypothetical protein
MEANKLTTSNVLMHLRHESEPFILHNGVPPQWSDAVLHQSVYESNPELYALLAVTERVQPAQRVRILFQLLRASRAGMTHPQRSILNRVTQVLLAILHPDQVLTVFLALRRVRANHKHTTKAILNYILNHSHFEDMAGCRRPALVDSLEHAMGKNVARACAKMLTNPSVADDAYLHRHLLKFARDPQWVKIIFPLLYQGTRQTGTGAYQQVHQHSIEKIDPKREQPATVTATNRGDISATLIHLYRGGTSNELKQALADYVQETASELPYFNGKVAVVLDTSESTRSYGQREYCYIAQSVALKLVLEKCCANVQVFSGNNQGEIPLPEGHSDLATALLDALETQPDLVAIISDGYENVYPGDLARVAATLPQIGIEIPVVFCHSKFTKNDDLNLRHCAPNLPKLEFWHQDDFESLILSLFSQANSQLSEATVQDYLLKKLDKIERVLRSE